MATGTFATVIGCIDGRTQSATSAWLKHYLQVDYVDTITEPGPDKVLLTATPDQLDAIKRKVLISINAHHSHVIAIAAHYDCAGNPVSDAEHGSMVRRCVDLISDWHLPVRVLGLWVNSDWQVELVTELAMSTAA